MSHSILEQIDKQIVLSQVLLDLSYKQQTAISATRLDKFIELGLEKDKLMAESQSLANLPDSYHQLSPERYESLPSAMQEEIDQRLIHLERLLHQAATVDAVNREKVSKKFQNIKAQLGGLKMGAVVHQTYGSQEVSRKFPEADRQAQYIDRKH